MTSHTEKQTKLVAAKVTPQEHRLIHSQAALRGQKASEAVREGLELWFQATLCPTCRQPTIPHPDGAVAADGVRYCPTCREAVEFAPSGNGAGRAATGATNEALAASAQA